MTAEWVATPARGTPFVSHVRLGPGVLCGEYRLKWEPVENFARPGVFRQCQQCLVLLAEKDGTVWAS